MEIQSSCTILARKFEITFILKFWCKPEKASLAQASATKFNSWLTWSSEKEIKSILLDSMSWKIGFIANLLVDLDWHISATKFDFFQSLHPCLCPAITLFYKHVNFHNHNWIHSPGTSHLNSNRFVPMFIGHSDTSYLPMWPNMLWIIT
jgi:hypothetical protein